MLPEEQELARLVAQQQELQDQLASAELSLKSIAVDTDLFKQRYYGAVGVLYAELDAINAKIARERARRAPDDQKAREEAEAFEEQARQSAEEAGLAIAEAKPAPEITPDLKQTYRKAVKLLHPDLASTEHERQRRTELMAQVNVAYERGDLAAIEKIMAEYGEDPEAITGEDVGSKIVKTIRVIARLRRRLEEVEQELDALKKTDTYLLKQAIEEQEANGDDPIGDLARDLKMQIDEKRKGLQ